MILWKRCSLSPVGKATDVGAPPPGPRLPLPGLRRPLRSGPSHPAALDGPTTLSNLALLCRSHHRAVHEEGYQVERQPDGKLRFRRPDGWLLPAVPPLVEVAGDPAGAIRARNEADGLVLHARTAVSGWVGEALDVRYAIDVLHPLAL